MSASVWVITANDVVVGYEHSYGDALKKAFEYKKSCGFLSGITTNVEEKRLNESDAYDLSLGGMPVTVKQLYEIAKHHWSEDGPLFVRIDGDTYPIVINETAIRFEDGRVVLDFGEQ